LFAKNTSKNELFLAEYMQWASSLICCLLSRNNTLADTILFLKQFDEIFGLTIYSGYCISAKLHKAKCYGHKENQLVGLHGNFAPVAGFQSRREKNDLAQIAQRLTAIENRISTSQTDESASIQEIRETLVFLSDQLSRLDKSVQTRTPRPIPKGASVFKPGGFNISSSYNTALSNYKVKQYEAAISGFKELLTVAPTSSLADNAQYWIGECYDALGNYDQALTALGKVFDYPKSNKLSDAHVKIGLIYVKMGRNDQAKEELKAVIDNYPGTNAASIAASKLKSMGE